MSEALRRLAMPVELPGLRAERPKHTSIQLTTVPESESQRVAIESKLDGATLR
jgi:hypothetical protein